VTAIDGIGYIPTYRKSYVDPWSETLAFWVLMALVGVFAILANAEYNLLTVTYLTVLTVLNIGLFALCAIRRKRVSKSQLLPPSVN